jgi:hypothetical protein
VVWQCVVHGGWVVWQCVRGEEGCGTCRTDSRAWAATRGCVCMHGLPPPHLRLFGISRTQSRPVAPVRLFPPPHRAPNATLHASIPHPPFKHIRCHAVLLLLLPPPLMLSAARARIFPPPPLPLQSLVAAVGDTPVSALTSDLVRVVEALVLQLQLQHSVAPGALHALAATLWNFAQDDTRTHVAWPSAASGTAAALAPYDPAEEDAALLAPGPAVAAPPPAAASPDADGGAMAPTALLSRLLGALAALVAGGDAARAPPQQELRSRLLRRVLGNVKASSSVPQVSDPPLSPPSPPPPHRVNRAALSSHPPTRPPTHPPIPAAPPPGAHADLRPPCPRRGFVGLLRLPSVCYLSLARLLAPGPVPQALFLLTQLVQADDGAFAGAAVPAVPAAGPAPPQDGVGTLRWLQARFDFVGLLLQDLQAYKRAALANLNSLASANPTGAWGYGMHCTGVGLLACERACSAGLPMYHRLSQYGLARGTLPFDCGCWCAVDRAVLASSVLVGRHPHPAQVSHRLNDLVTVLQKCETQLSPPQVRPHPPPPPLPRSPNDTITAGCGKLGSPPLCEPVTAETAVSGGGGAWVSPNSRSHWGLVACPSR